MTFHLKASSINFLTPQFSFLIDLVTLPGTEPPSQ